MLNIVSMDAKYIRCGYVYIFLLFGPVILASSSKSNDETCPEISKADCLKKLQTFLKLTSLPFTSDETELNKLCNNTVAGYFCSGKVYNCSSSHEKEIFQVFLNMAQYTMLMYCTSGDQKIGEGYLRKALLKHSECILSQKEAIDCCAAGAEVVDFPVLHILETNKSLIERQIGNCCPVANYIKCAEAVVEKNCGEDAANLTVEYIRRSSGEPFEAVCQKLPDYPELNAVICKTPTPVCSGSKTEVLLELIVTLCLVLIMRIYPM